MKKNLSCFVIILFLSLVFILCFIFIKPRLLKFDRVDEYIYFINHVEEIDKIVLESYTMLGKKNYLINNEVGTDFLTNLKIRKKFNGMITDSDMSLCVYFKNTRKKCFDFEAEYFKYNGVKYSVNKNIYDLINNNEIEILE